MHLLATAIDNSCPALPDGRRLDCMDRSGHYARWEEDLEHVRALGAGALRYGPPYYRTHVAPDAVDFDCCDEPMARLRTMDVPVIATLCRAGVPTWLGGFQDPAFPVLFAEYARAFARRYPWVRWYTPVADVLASATASALEGRWNECERSDRAFHRAIRNLCLANELAVEAILAERADAMFVQWETAAPSAEAHRWLVLDLLFGHELPGTAARALARSGMTSNELSYFREPRVPERRWVAVTLQRPDGAAAPAIRRVAQPVVARYGAPVLLDVDHGAEGAAEWLVACDDQLRALRAAGVPATGLAWRDLLDGAVAPAGSPASGLLDPNRMVRTVGAAFSALARRHGESLRIPDGRRDRRGSGACA